MVNIFRAPGNSWQISILAACLWKTYCKRIKSQVRTEVRTDHNRGIHRVSGSISAKAKNHCHAHSLNIAKNPCRASGKTFRASGKSWKISILGASLWKTYCKRIKSSVRTELKVRLEPRYPPSQRLNLSKGKKPLPHTPFKHC